MAGAPRRGASIPTAGCRRDSSAPAGTTGLVAAYSFSEGTGNKVADISGNGNTGTLTNGAWTTLGKYGRALVFNGTNALVTINDSPSLHLSTGMTLEAWVKPSVAKNASADVVYKGADAYFLQSSSGTKLPSGGGSFGTTPVKAASYGLTPLPLNTWTHIAQTYDGVTIRFYVNGVQVSSRAQTGNIVTTTNSLQIGGDSIYGQYFKGLIDDVRVYNRALSQAEVLTDSNSPVGQ